MTFKTDLRVFGDAFKDHADNLLGERFVPSTQREYQRARLVQVEAVARLLTDEWEAL